MNKSAYIFYLAALITCFALTYKAGYNVGKEKETVKQDSVANANVKEESDDGYWIKAEDGIVVVYEKDRKTIVATTDINVETLTNEEQMALKDGHYFATAKELFSFLESNTS